MVYLIARDSKLSKAQVEEFKDAWYKSFPGEEIQADFIKTYGDLDHSISLRDNFFEDLFTRELDQALIEKKADIAIHSAKDLPNNLHPDLEVVFYSRSKESRDSLVFKEGFDLNNIPKGGVILASSLRRENAVKDLRNDVAIKDVRGTIEERLELLSKDNIYGVVIAEIALIRLKLEHLPRLILDIPTHPRQGQLAIVGLKDNIALRNRFSNFSF